MTTTPYEALAQASLTQKKARDAVSEFHEFWKSTLKYPAIEPIVSLLLIVLVSVLDLCESTGVILSTLSGDPKKELLFLTKAASRPLVLQVFEQERKLHRYSKEILKIGEKEGIKIDNKNFRLACQESKEDLAYIRSLKDIRNEAGHYNDDHLKILTLIDKIEVVKIVNGAGSLIRCYSALSDLIDQALKAKMQEVSLPKIDE